MTEQSIAVQIIMTLITSGVVGGIVTYYTRRDTNRVKVRLAEIEAAKEETRGDTATASGLLTVATTAIQMLEPLRKTLENVAAATTQAVEAVNTLMARTDEMHQVVDRRDKEFQQDRETSATRYQDIVTRLNTQQTAIEEVTKQITISTDESMLRSEISKIVLRSDEIVRLVTMLLLHNEPGEAKEVTPEPSVEKSQEG
jgi:hypothetical protein